jgi:hypothetical protein
MTATITPAIAARIAALAAAITPADGSSENTARLLQDALVELVEFGTTEALEGFDFSDVREITDAIESQVEKTVEQEVEKAVDELDLPDFDDYVKFEDSEQFIRDNDLVNASDLESATEGKVSTDDMESALEDKADQSDVDDAMDALATRLQNYVDGELRLVTELKARGWRGLVRRVKFLFLGC